MEINDKLKTLPTKPGVYLMKDTTGAVIYVGKAVNLRNRVRSYFHARHQGIKVQTMVEHIADFEYIVTDAEVEALILESHLIKEHAPRYNVRLKDDKYYPYIKVTHDERFPRVFLVRQRVQDGARYFGPFASAGAVRDTLDLLRKVFPIRTCRKAIGPGQQDRPCLNFHIGRCQAPCADLVDEASYRQMIAEVCLFLEGRQDRLIPELERRMAAAAADLAYEKAAKLRDQIRVLRQITEKQKIVASHHEDQDVLGFYRAGELACVQVFFVRNGKLIGRDHFLMDCSVEAAGAEILAAFIQQYYGDTTFVPREILLPVVLPDADVIARWLASVKGVAVYLRTPQRGPKRRLVSMVTDNARLVLEEIRSKAERKQQELEAGLKELQEVLNLPTPPHRIEAYDISNTQGDQIVGSMVVLCDGVPTSDAYRRFRIRSVEEGPNDYLAMQEVLRRRFTRGLKERSGEVEGDRFSQFPDLVLVDGGKGQLHAALAVQDELSLDIPFIGLAKQFEEIYVEGRPQPLLLPRQSPGQLMLQRVRDEAHRFAVTYHRQLRAKRGYGSVLDTIPGIGSKRKKALIRHFGTVKRIQEADIAQLMEVDGIHRKLAEEIVQSLRLGER